MTSIHVTLSPVASAEGSGNASGASANPADLAGLQRKMVALMKEMKDASADRTPGAKERVELLQVRIQACQMQIEQVQAAAAQKAQLKQAAQSPAADGGAPARAADGAIGRNIDVMA